MWIHRATVTTSLRGDLRFQTNDDRARPALSSICRTTLDVITGRRIMTPLVSILIPAFNAARWIDATLESALGQTHPRIEIIVVDDGSTDETLVRAHAFAGHGVRVVTQP